MKKLVLIGILLSVQAFAYSVGPQEYAREDRNAVLQSNYIKKLAADRDLKVVNSGYQQNGDALFEVTAGDCTMELVVKHQKIPFGIGNGMVTRTVDLVDRTGC